MGSDPRDDETLRRKKHVFDQLSPRRLGPDAAKLVKTGDAKLLSGGMTLIPTMKTRLAAPSDLVDLSRIKELQGIKVSGKTVTIGAATTHYDVARDEKLKKACPALAQLASLIGDPAVRHLGTIGGSIANNDPAADYPAALLALGATIVTNKRQIARRQVLQGPVRDGVEGRRDRHRHHLHGASQGGL